MIRTWLMGFCVAFAWVAAAAGPVRGGDAADAELKFLAERVVLAGKDVTSLRADLIRFGQRFPGTAQAVKAAGFLRELPSPLDQLDAKNIPELEKFPWHPKETVAVLGEHRGRQGGAATAVAYSKNGKWLASTSTNGYIRIWDPANMRLLHTLGHGQGGYCVTFSKDNSLIAHGGGDGQVILQDMTVNPPKIKETCKVASTPLMGLALDPKLKWFVTGGSDTRLYLWDLTENPPKEQTGANAHTGPIHAVAVSPDGKTIASGGADKTIRTWTLAANRMKEKASLEGHAGAVMALAFHPTEDKTLASGGADGVIRIWTQTGGKLTPRFSLKGKGGTVNHLTFSASGKTLAAAWSDGNVRSYTVATSGALVEKSVYEGHNQAATGVAFSPDGTTLVSCSSDWTVRQWPGVAGPRPKDKTIKSGHWSHVYTLAFAPDEKGLASGSYDTTTRFWALPAADVKENAALMKGDNFVYTLAFAPDGKTVASGGASGTFRTYDPATGRFIFAFPGHTGHVSRLVYAPDGSAIASCSTDKTVRLWDPKKGKGLTSITAFETHVASVTFSPDGKHLLCASGYYLYDKAGRIVVKNGLTQYLDSTVRLYDAASLKEKFRWKSDTLLTSCIAFAPDGKQFFAAASDGVLRNWDTAMPPKEAGIYHKGNTSGISVLAPSADGRWIASYGPDYRINLFELPTGKIAKSFTVGEQFGALAWAPDSRHLAISVGTGVTLVLRVEEAKKQK